MKLDWESMKFEEQLKWIDQAEFLQKRGFFTHEKTDDLAKRIFEAKQQC
jgi:hypothetical protein